MLLRGLGPLLRTGKCTKQQPRDSWAANDTGSLLPCYPGGSMTRSDATSVLAGAVANLSSSSGGGAGGSRRGQKCATGARKVRPTPLVLPDPTADLCHHHTL